MLNVFRVHHASLDCQSTLFDELVHGRKHTEGEWVVLIIFVNERVPRQIQCLQLLVARQDFKKRFEVQRDQIVPRDVKLLKPLRLVNNLRYLLQVQRIDAHLDQSEGQERRLVVDHELEQVLNDLGVGRQVDKTQSAEVVGRPSVENGLDRLERLL